MSRPRKFIKLADETMRELDVAPDGEWAVGFDARAYLRNEKVLPAADYLPGQHVDRRADADRQGPAHRPARLRHQSARHPLPLLEGRDDHGLRPRRGHGQGARRREGRFTDTEYDHPGTKPSYGIAGYTSDGKGVIVNHRYDLWLVPLDGSAPRT